MSSAGEVYITDSVPEILGDEIDSIFGMGSWRLDASEWYMIYDIQKIQEYETIKVFDASSQKVIGEITVKNDVLPDRDQWGYIDWDVLPREITGFKVA